MQHTSIEVAYALMLQIPEFVDPYEIYELRTRLQATHRILLAQHMDEAVGFKLGYELEPGTFYSWIGGVLPAYRRKGIARLLADRLEEELIAAKYHTLRMKTRNKHKAMLLFALGNDFEVTGFEQREPSGESRILLEKRLT